MSRIGNKIIEKLNANVVINDKTISVSSSNGSLDLHVFKNLSVEVSDNTILIKRLNNDKETKAKHGLLRSLVNNAIIGVTKGYSYNMFLQGIGYRVQLKGNDLEFLLGYSHPVLYKAPDGIKFTVNGQDKFQVYGIDKQLVGQVCSEIKRLRKKDSYKGKGIFFENEVIRKKPGKSVK